MKPILSIMRTQGVTNATLDTLIRFMGAKKKYAWQIGAAPPDAAVDRARGTIASDFLDREADVLVMMDYDISIPDMRDLEYIAEKACELEAVVGAVVSKRGLGLGFGCSFVDGKDHEILSDELVELTPGRYMGGACTAYHRSVFTALIDSGKMPFCPGQGFYPFFLPCITEHPETGEPFYLSEDWALCHYLHELTDKKVYAAMRPYVLHHGAFAYSPLEGNSAP